MNALFLPNSGNSPFSQSPDRDFEAAWNLVFELRVEVFALEALFGEIKEHEFELWFTRLTERTMAVMRLTNIAVKQNLKPDLLDICATLQVLAVRLENRKRKKWSNRIKSLVNSLCHFLRLAAPFAGVALPAPDPPIALPRRPDRASLT